MPTKKTFSEKELMESIPLLSDIALHGVLQKIHQEIANRRSDGTSKIESELLLEFNENSSLSESERLEYMVLRKKFNEDKGLNAIEKNRYGFLIDKKEQLIVKRIELLRKIADLRGQPYEVAAEQLGMIQ